MAKKGANRRIAQYRRNGNLRNEPNRGDSPRMWVQIAAILRNEPIFGQSGPLPPIFAAIFAAAVLQSEV